MLKSFPQRTEADLYIWVAYHRERLKQRYGEMPPDRDVAATLRERFSGRPVGRFVKMISRAVNAAVKAAAESPEPPPPDATPKMPKTATELTGERTLKEE